MGKRRGHGEGSISKRPNGTWQAQINLGRDPITGRRIRRTVYGRTQREVAQKLLEMRAEISARGSLSNPGQFTVGEYLQRWLDDAARHEIKETTLEGYRRYIRLHAASIAGVKLSHLEPTILQRLYSERLASGLGPTTVRQLHAILHRAFKQAVLWGFLKLNPADGVAAPRPRRKELAVYTSDQVRQLLDIILDDPYGPLYYLAATSGMRRGELCALRWSDVDLERGVIAVNRAVMELKSGIQFAEPKNLRSRRLVTLTAGAVAILQDYREKQAAARQPIIKAGLLQDQNLLFCYNDGRPFRPSQVSRHLGILLKRLGMPHIRLHDLRHTHATLLLGAGVHPKIVSERLGHSTITLTLDTYSHVLPTMQREAANTLEKLLTRPSASMAVGQRP